MYVYTHIVYVYTRKKEMRVHVVIELRKTAWATSADPAARRRARENNRAMVGPFFPMDFVYSELTFLRKKEKEKK